MFKTFIAIAAATVSLCAGAQVVSVRSIDKVPMTGLAVNIARVSPDGTFAVASSNDDNSLYTVNLSNGQTSRLQAEGSALELSFAPDGSAIVYKSSTMKSGHLRYYSVKTLDLSKGNVRSLTAESRHCPSFSVSPMGVLSMNEKGRHSAKSLSGASTSAAQAVVGINRGHLEVTVPGGKSKFIDPQGEGSYLWPSLSPDGKKIVYYLVGAGCFTCNLDGSDVRPLGYVHAPRWLNNNVVVGCQDYDNGSYITSSTIVATDMSGNIQALTGPDVIGINPSATADGSAVLFSTPAGELYVITLNK